MSLAQAGLITSPVVLQQNRPTKGYTPWPAGRGNDANGAMNFTYRWRERKKKMLWAFQEEFEFQHETTFQTWLTHPISQFPSMSPSLSLAHSIHTKVCVLTQTPFVSVNSGLFSLNGKAASNVGISQMK